MTTANRTGELSVRIRVERLAPLSERRAPDGEPMPVFVPLGERWAKIRAVTSSRQDAIIGEATEQLLDIDCEGRLDVRTDDRVVDITGGRTFDVVAVCGTDGRAPLLADMIQIRARLGRMRDVQ